MSKSKRKPPSGWVKAKARGVRAVMLWLKPDEYADIRDAATKDGRTVAGYCKRSVLLLTPRSQPPA